MTTKDVIIEEALENARKDRQTIVDFRKKLIDIAMHPVMDAEPLGIVAVAEHIAKISDTLTKVNSQLVELSKIASKTKEEDSQFDKDSLFDEIETNN